MLLIPKAGESCCLLGPRERQEHPEGAAGTGKGTGSSVTSALRHAEEPGTEGHQRDPRTCSKSEPSGGCRMWEWPFKGSQEHRGSSLGLHTDRA